VKRTRGSKINYGFILINTIPKQEHKVYNSLSYDSDIIEVQPLFGEFDLIAKYKLKSLSKKGKKISKKIRDIDGVLDTKLI
jgi:DNA-binding Lrp family transcriptional regulator